MMDIMVAVMSEAEESVKVGSKIWSYKFLA